MSLIEVDFWDFYRLNEYRHQEIANLAILLYIHMNPRDAAKIIQKAVNFCGMKVIEIKVDGVIGSKSIQAINSLAPRWFADRLRLETIAYYLKEADRDIRQRNNFRGWVRRALR